MSWAIIYMANQSREMAGGRGFLREFALFPLLLSRQFAYKQNGTCSGCSQNTPLTTNHLPSKGESWLLTSVPKNRIAASRSSRKPKARSLLKLNCPSRPITTLSRLSFRTRPHSRSILNHAYRLCLNWSVGNRAITVRSNAGDLFTASNQHFPI